MRTLLIVNPISGQGKAEAALLDLEEYFRGVERLETHARGDAERFAREAVGRGVERILVAGGDGTINEVANALAGTDVVLGVIGLGTGNVLARELGIPVNDVPGAAEILAKGRVARLDLGKANGRYFLLMAGVGFDAEVVHHVAPALKDALGAPAYILTGIATLTHYRPVRTLLEIDDHRIAASTYLTIVANATSYAYDVKVTPLASMEDGLLDICVFRERFSLNFIRQILRVLAGRHLKHPHIRYYTGKRIYLECYPPAAVQLDGDYFGETPVEIVVEPKALAVVVPG